MTDDRLFDPGEPIATPVDEYRALSPDQRRTVRRRKALAAGVHPTTGRPLLAGSGATCGTCDHHVTHTRNRTYHKCDRMPMTGGPATDVVLSWPACDLWKPQS